MGGAIYFGTRDADPLKPIMVRGLERNHGARTGLPSGIRVSTHSSSTGSVPSAVLVSIGFFFPRTSVLRAAGAGAIVGPSLGTALWRTRHRSLTQAIDAKDTEFFHRIAKNRVDATLQSPTQPVPDYYGKFLV